MWRKALERYDRIEFWVLSFWLLLMGSVLLLQIVVRYFGARLGLSFGWTEELARYLQVMLTFLGLGFGLRHGAHVAMLTVRDKLPVKVRMLADIFGYVLLLFLLVKFLPALQRFLAYQGRISATSMPIKMGIFYSVAPIGVFFLGVYSIYRVQLAVRQLVASRRSM